jgi:hypothetical protein
VAAVPWVRGVRLQAHTHLTHGTPNGSAAIVKLDDQGAVGVGHRQRWHEIDEAHHVAGGTPRRPLAGACTSLTTATRTRLPHHALPPL